MYREQVVEIPYEEIPEALLRRVIEEFVTREGTDYGEVVYDLDQKVERVMALLDRGHAKVMFEAQSNSINIINNKD